MALTQYGPWAPDQPDLGNTCTVATNVTKTVNGYGPFPLAVPFSGALPAGCIGAISFKQVDGTKETFAGTATDLFRLSGTTWNSVKRTSPAYTSSAFWRFVVYGKRLVATNGVDNPQAFDLGVDTIFADLPNAPICRFFIIIRDVLVALDLVVDTVNQIAFSAVNDSQKWTPDCGGGLQPLADGGPVIGGTGGEIGVVLQENAIRRMDFVGGDLRFTFDEVEGAMGALGADSIVRYKGRTFYLSEEGFQQFNGVESQNISDEIVTEFFFKDATSPETIRGVLNPRASVVAWLYASATGTRMISYNFRLQTWTLSLHPGATCPVLFVGAKTVLSIFDSADKLATLNGANSAAILSTGLLSLNQDQTTMVSTTKAAVDGKFDLTIGVKMDLEDKEMTVMGSSVSGKVDLMVNAAFHRFEVRPKGAWTYVLGVDPKGVPSGRRI